MFRKKSRTLFPPAPLSLQEVLSDLKAFQTYTRSNDNEGNKAKVLEVVDNVEEEKSPESSDTSNSNIPCMSLIMLSFFPSITESQLFLLLLSSGSIQPCFFSIFIRNWSNILITGSCQSFNIG
jgi:hypothetical protein